MFAVMMLPGSTGRKGGGAVADASTLRKLASLDLAPAQMAGVLGIIADLVEAEERRREKQRARKARSRDKSVIVTGQERDEDVTVTVTPSPKEKSPAPPKEITPSSSLRSQRPQRVRASRIPDDFVPDTAVGEELGLSPDEAQTEADAFVDYWRSKPTDATKLDWPATWRNWCRRAAKDRGARAQAPPRQRIQNGFAAYAIDLARQDHDAAAHDDRETPGYSAGGFPAGRGPQDPGLLDTGQPEPAGGAYAGTHRR